MPSPRPSAPIPSAVVAATFTADTSSPSADANRAPDRPRRALGLIYYGVSAREGRDQHEAYQRKLAAEMKQAGRI